MQNEAKPTGIANVAQVHEVHVSSQRRRSIEDQTCCLLPSCFYLARVQDVLSHMPTGQRVQTNTEESNFRAFKPSSDAPFGPTARNPKPATTEKVFGVGLEGPSTFGGGTWIPRAELFWAGQVFQHFNAAISKHEDASIIDLFDV